MVEGGLRLGQFGIACRYRFRIECDHHFGSQETADFIYRICRS